MILSMLTFAYIVSGAVGLLVLMSLKLYTENSKYSAELKFHLQQKTIASNLAKAKLSVVQSQFNELSKNAKVENNEELNLLKQEAQKLKDKMDEVYKEFNSEIKNEKEKTEIAMLNFTEMENLNKNLAQELNAFEDAHVALKQEMNKIEDVHQALRKEIEMREAKLNESNKEKKVLLTKLVGYESREEILQSKVSDQSKQIQALEVQKRNQNLMIETISEKAFEKEKISNELKESNEILSQKLSEEHKKVSAHEKIDSINRRDRELDESKKEFEKILMKRVLKAYSVILRLEKKNLSLKNELKNNKKQYEQEVKNNVLRFPTKLESHRPQEVSRSEIKLKNIKNLLSDNKKYETGKVELNELEFLKAKLDEARKSLFEIQSSQDFSEEKKKIAA